MSTHPLACALIVSPPHPPAHAPPGRYGLAYMQVQLALTSLVIVGVYAAIVDMGKIIEFGLWHNFNGVAALSVFNR